jgi:acetolactate synthase-1/2/3 large subunit
METLMNDSPRPLARHMSETPVNLPANRQEAAYYSDAFVEFLSQMQVDYVFLLPGSSFRGLHDSLVNFGRNHKPQIIMATHEQIAVSMAHGYSKATGKLGVCMLHNLVGLMNGSMAVYNAYGDHAPVMVIGGSGPFDPADRRWIDWLHCANQQSEIVKPYVKWADDPTTGQATLDALARGYKAAMTPPTGPVYVTVDCALQERPIEGVLRTPDAKTWQVAPPIAANPDALTKAAEMLLAAEFPLIVGGRFGINPAVTAPLVDLVELTGAGYRDDLALIAFPTAHKQNLSGDRAAIKEADVVLTIDCRDVSSLLDAYTDKKKEVGSGRDRGGLKVIDISLNDMAWTSWSYLQGSQAPVDLQISCDPLLGMKQLADVVRTRLQNDTAARTRVERRKATIAQRHDQLRARQREAVRKGWDDSPITPGRMVSELWQAVKDKDWLLAVRNQASFPEGIWQFTGAGQYLGHNGGGGVGYGPGAAVGAAIACRDAGKFCVAIFGDGDYVMSSSAIWTAVHHRAPMLALINDNRTWGNDEKHQIEVAGDRNRPVDNAWIGQRMVDPDINHAMNARSYGAWAAGPISDPAELAEVLKQAVAEVDKGHVAVVEVRTKLI